MAIHIGNVNLGHCFVKDISSKKFIHKITDFQCNSHCFNILKPHFGKMTNYAADNSTNGRHIITVVRRLRMWFNPTMHGGLCFSNPSQSQLLLNVMTTWIQANGYPNQIKILITTYVLPF